MAQIMVQIKIRCASCHTTFQLSQEQYRELVKRSRVALNCPHCSSSFEYNPVTMATASKPTASPRAGRNKVIADAVSAPELSSSPVPPVVTAAVVLQYPPPPFAPLNGGSSILSNAPPPPFAPLTAAPFAPMVPALVARVPAGRMGYEAKKLSLNERWKQLPPWIQWTVIGALIVIMAVLIFALPTGGGNGSLESEPSKVSEPSRTGFKKDRSNTQGNTTQEKKAETGKKRADEEKKVSNKGNQERQP